MSLSRQASIIYDTEIEMDMLISISHRERDGRWELHMADDNSLNNKDGHKNRGNLLTFSTEEEVASFLVSDRFRLGASFRRSFSIDRETFKWMSREEKIDLIAQCISHLNKKQKAA